VAPEIWSRTSTLESRPPTRSSGGPAANAEQRGAAVQRWTDVPRLAHQLAWRLEAQAGSEILCPPRFHQPAQTPVSLRIRVRRLNQRRPIPEAGSR
jgi:hypothetical protein